MKGERGKRAGTLEAYFGGRLCDGVVGAVFRRVALANFFYYSDILFYKKNYFVLLFIT